MSQVLCLLIWNMAATYSLFASPMMPYQSLYNFVTCRLSYNDFASSKFQHWKREHKAAHSAKLRIKFIQDCLQEQVLPRTMKYLADFNANGVPYPLHCTAIMKDRIASLRWEKEVKFELA